MQDAGLHELANVRVLPYANREELLRLYQVARVYFLPSLVEGMPNSLCEGMLCGCIPVATRVGGVSEVLGTLGFQVTFGDVEGTNTALGSALEAPATEGGQMRSRILDFFPLARREREIMQVVTEVLS